MISDSTWQKMVETLMKGKQVVGESTTQAKANRSPLERTVPNY